MFGLKGNFIILLRWLYTGVINLDDDEVALRLLCTAHTYKLHALFELCEQALIKAVNITSCAKLHCIATEVGATTILKHCKRIASIYWDYLEPQSLDDSSNGLVDFENPCDIEMKVSTLMRRHNTDSYACCNL